MHAKGTRFGPRFYNRKKYDARLKPRKGGRLELDLGRGNDKLNVRKLSNGLYRFDVADKTTGKRQRFDLTRGQVSRLTVKLGRGNDQAVIDPNVDQPFSIQGNRGKDTIHNGAHGMKISGGKHRDKIVNSGNFVSMHGGKHRDRIINSGSYSHMNGGRGRDTIDDYGVGNRVEMRGGSKDTYRGAYPWANDLRADMRDRINGITGYQATARGHWGSLGVMPPYYGHFGQSHWLNAAMPQMYFAHLGYANWGVW